jgi:DNA-binding response OmpR family regulator
MIARAAQINTQSCRKDIIKPRLLLISDSDERLQTLKLGINSANFEIKCLSSLDGLHKVCRNAYDLVALNVTPGRISGILELIRMSTGLRRIPVLVESAGINADLDLAGVLPHYRAMPCSHAELIKLLENHIEIQTRADSYPQNHIV